MTDENSVKPLPLFNYIRFGMQQTPRSFMRPLMGAERAAIADILHMCQVMMIELREAKNCVPESLKKYIDDGACNVALIDLATQARTILQLSDASQARLTELRESARGKDVF
jgi:hypothetical protein